MKKLFASSALLLAVTVFVGQPARAQGPQAPGAAAPAAGQAPQSARQGGGPGGGAPGGAPGGGAQAGGGGGRGAAAPPQIDLATAKTVIAAAEAAANAGNIKVAIAVVDANGDLVYLERMDGAPSGGPPSSQAKARAAIVFGMPGKAVAEAAAAGTPVSTTVTVAGGNNQIILIQQGGYPIMRGGKLIGAVGAGGSTGANDDIVAKAGADAIK